MNVYFRDVEHILAAIALPVVLPHADLLQLRPALGAKEWAVDVLHYGNLVSPFVISIRGALFNGEWPTLVDMVYCVVAAVATLSVGLLVFRRLEREMAVEL